MLGQVPMRLAAGQVAATVQDICQGTGLSAEAVRKSLTVGKELGLLEVRPTPWGMQIGIVNWQDILRKNSNA